MCRLAGKISYIGSRLRLKRDGTRAETRFGLSVKWTSPFKSVGASFHSTPGSRGVRISGSNAGYTVFQGGVREMATYSIRRFPIHFPSLASPCAIRFQLNCTKTSIITYGTSITVHLNYDSFVFRWQWRVTSYDEDVLWKHCRSRTSCVTPYTELRLHPWGSAVAGPLLYAPQYGTLSLR
jgi:hypothetical protein